MTDLKIDYTALGVAANAFRAQKSAIDEAIAEFRGKSALAADAFGDNANAAKAHAEYVSATTGALKGLAGFASSLEAIATGFDHVIASMQRNDAAGSAVATTMGAGQ